jgi:hypothetical protein
LHVYLLDRLDPDGRIARIETRTDRLARELLAPDDELERRFGARPLDEPDLVTALREGFGLPPAEARVYARRWLAARRRPGFLDRLGV